MILGIIATLLVVAAIPTADKTHTLRYDLPVGMSYEYQVVTDSKPFANKVVRLHTRIVLDVVGRDDFDNTVCRFSVSADTSYSTTDNVLSRDLGMADFAGHRLYAKAGYVDVLLDAHGNVASTDAEKEDANRGSAISTQFRKTAPSTSSMAAVSGSNPYMLQLLMPSVPTASSFEIQREYADTLTIPSRSVYVPTSYGTSNNVVHKVLYDTVYRVSILDSVHVVGPESYGYMTLRSVRRTALGSLFSSESHLVRDMHTGLIQSITETSYKGVDRRDRQLDYISTANLLTQAPMSTLRLRDGNRTGVR